MIKESKRVGCLEMLQHRRKSSGHGITPRWTGFRVLCAHEGRTPKRPSSVCRRTQAGVCQAETEIDLPLSTSLQDDPGAQVSLQLYLHMLFAALLNWHIADLARMPSIP